MKKSNYIILNRFYFRLINPSKINHLFISVLVILAVNAFSDFVFKSQSAVAQYNEINSLSLDKNIIYVNPKLGDDSQSGEKSTPFKTITKALKDAAPGSKIQLAVGEYNESTGESFPLIINNNITLQGNTNTQGVNIIIQGSGDFVSPTGAGQNVAIAALKDAGKIAGITITNNHSRGHGLWIESSSPEIVGNTFTRNGNTGVSVNGKSSPLIENNYFYNNSGNGLLVYGTSKVNAVENTFEQTGFGASLVQNTSSVFNNNYFDGNRIGIILEGNSQATLRDNEIVNSLESGLTAIAQSRADLGTTEEPGNNIFRSNKKLDIQNSTNSEIVAVGTEINGDIQGNINFDRGEFIATNDTKQATPLLTPLDSGNSSAEPQKLSAATVETSLPSPPPVIEQKTSSKEKELVFTSSSSTVSETPDPEPVPSLPQISNSALNANSSQVSSLSDVLGSRDGASIKYKVLVEAGDQNAELKVRSLYPQAFATVYQGQPVLQIGAFNNWGKAKEAKNSIDNLGLSTHILE